MQIGCLGLSAASSLLTSQISINCISCRSDDRPLSQKQNQSRLNRRRATTQRPVPSRKTQVPEDLHKPRTHVPPSRRPATNRRNPANSPKLRPHPVHSASRLTKLSQSRALTCQAYGGTSDATVRLLGRLRWLMSLVLFFTDLSPKLNAGPAPRPQCAANAP